MTLLKLLCCHVTPLNTSALKQVKGHFFFFFVQTNVVPTWIHINIVPNCNIMSVNMLVKKKRLLPGY